MADDKVLELLKKTNSILEGHFLLSSGLHSSQYLQCARLLQHPVYAEEVCSKIAIKFKDADIDVVVAPALGGILVSYEVARSLGVRGLFVERINGKMQLRRGFELMKNERVLVVEDVITTGLSTREVIAIVKAHNAKLAGIGCIIDRGTEINFGVRFESLLKLNIPVFFPCEESNEYRQ